MILSRYGMKIYTHMIRRAQSEKMEKER